MKESLNLIILLTHLEAVTLELPNNNEVCLEGYIKAGEEEIEVTFKWSTVVGAGQLWYRGHEHH